VVVSMTTPPLISLLGTCIQKLRGSRHLIWEQDVYPDIAVDLRHLREGSLLHRLTGALADWSRRHADGIVVLGECMRDRLVSRGVAPEKIVVAEHWANSQSITPLPRPGDPNELVLLYSGNLGLAHDLDTILGAMQALRDDRRFRFLFAGTGGRREALAAFCEANGIGSVEMRPFVARDKLSEGLAAGDIGLVTQQHSACGSVVPSKVYGILAAGRPLLFIGPASATPARILRRHGCGWHVPCGDVDGLTKLLQHLAANRQEVTQAGARAREALLAFYDLPQSVDRLGDILGAAPRTGRQTRTESAPSTLKPARPLPN
jgi:glycosyltransferase involved in cell wall biosynthesis